MDKIFLIERCLNSCGTGPFLVTGEGNLTYAYLLLLWQNNVYSASLPLSALSSCADVAYDNILIALSENDLDEKDLIRFIGELYRISIKSVCLVADIDKQVDDCMRDTGWWQSRFFAAGFRLHPRSFHLLNYNSREHPPSPALLCFEKISESVLKHYPLEQLGAERSLHMDMLRESGRRSDAHIVRYFNAAPYIRPGDTVLDCACGLGYGAHILYQNSRASRVLGIDFSESAIAYAKDNYGIPGAIDYLVGDAQNLSSLTDNSIDFIASFETIEHLPEPRRYLKEFFRILRPSGRVIFSAPDQWIDETGKDPNPHHFHVYNWEKLYREVTEYFLPDRGFIQIAGGALRLPDGKRHWEEVPCQLTMEKEAEWVLLLAMKNPSLGQQVPYVETTFPVSNNPDYHVGAFGKDYLNPWLLKGMIAIGYRLENKTELKKLHQEALSGSPPNSVDYGAALCGKGYRLLEKTYTSNEEVDSFLVETENYIARVIPTPHAMRWKVSLLFAAALLQRSLGNMAAAETLFLRCANYDVVQYSALLGNKTCEALYHAAILALGRGDHMQAEQRLRKVLLETQRLMQGSGINSIHTAEKPFIPGYAECCTLWNLAARCCYVAEELKTSDIRPGLLYEVAHFPPLDNSRSEICFWKTNNQRLQAENQRLQAENQRSSFYIIFRKIYRILKRNTFLEKEKD
jgi:SAM-dependent methyltransferase